MNQVLNSVKHYSYFIAGCVGSAIIFYLGYRLGRLHAEANAKMREIQRTFHTHTPPAPDSPSNIRLNAKKKSSQPIIPSESISTALISTPSTETGNPPSSPKKPDQVDPLKTSSKRVVWVRLFEHSAINNGAVSFIIKKLNEFNEQSDPLKTAGIKICIKKQLEDPETPCIANFLFTRNVQRIQHEEIEARLRDYNFSLESSAVIFQTYQSDAYKKQEKTLVKMIGVKYRYFECLCHATEDHAFFDFNNDQAEKLIEFIKERSKQS